MLTRAAFQECQRKWHKSYHFENFHRPYEVLASGRLPIGQHAAGRFRYCGSRVPLDLVEAHLPRRCFAMVSHGITYDFIRRHGRVGLDCSSVHVFLHAIMFIVTLRVKARASMRQDRQTSAEITDGLETTSSPLVAPAVLIKRVDAESKQRDLWRTRQRSRYHGSTAIHAWATKLRADGAENGGSNRDSVNTARRNDEEARKKERIFLLALGLAGVASRHDLVFESIDS
jgi:hypothetical protein